MYDPKIALAMKTNTVTASTPTPKKAAQTDGQTSKEEEATPTPVKDSPKPASDVLNQFKQKLALLAAKPPKADGE